MVKVEQQQWTSARGWNHVAAPTLADAQMVLVFGGPSQLTPDVIDAIGDRYPSAVLFGCSTAGEIADTVVFDDTVVATAVHFDFTTVRLVTTLVEEPDDSYAAGQRLATQLAGDDLRHVLVLSDGLVVNGSRLADGMASSIGSQAVVSGGLAGDGWRFERTFVVAGREVRSGMVAAVGLYGDRLNIGCASYGGYDSFGPERLVTRSRGNILYELDGQSALALYKKYLGPHAGDLPSSGLLFPLAVRLTGEEDSIVRTILSIDEDQQSLIFAGDIPEGAHARLMKTNFDRLVDGAISAARACDPSMIGADFALLVSCVGRKLVLKQRTEEEVEAVREVLGPVPAMTGFYSYGELSPFASTGQCRLHNQSMTITTLSEA
jgi:hypothetical protein